MGKQLITIDDISGQPLEEGQGEHITFSVNGTEYEMDLSRDNAKKFHDALSLYVDKANKVGTEAPARRATKPAGAKPKRDPEQLQAIREWARENGYEVSDRGRIAANIEEAYNEAHK